MDTTIVNPDTAGALPSSYTQKNNNRSGQRQRETYRAAGRSMVALQMAAGDSIFLSHNQAPRTRLLAMGEHYDFIPPYRGRPGDHNQSKDTTSASKLVAMADIIVNLHDPWQDFRGGLTIGHIRLARKTSCAFDILEMMPDRFREGLGYRKGAKLLNKPEHLVTGGPAGAIVYEDECVVPAYFYGEDRSHLPYVYIVDEQELPLLDATFVESKRDERAAASGREMRITAAACGALTRKKVAEIGLVITMDTHGRVFGLDLNDQPVAFYSFPNGVTLRRNELISDSRVRAALGLNALPFVGTPKWHQTAAARPGRAINGLDKAFAEIEQQQKAASEPKKEVPVAVRRAAPPKLSEVTPEAVAQPEPAHTGLEALDELPAVDEEGDAYVSPDESQEQEAESAVELEIGETQGDTYATPEETSEVVAEAAPAVSPAVRLIASVQERLNGKPLPLVKDATGGVLIEAGGVLTEEVAELMLLDPFGIHCTEEAAPVCAALYELAEELDQEGKVSP